jgi:hypothetical protein
MHTLLGHVSDDAKDLIARIQSLNNGDGVWICRQNSLFFFFMAGLLKTNTFLIIKDSSLCYL